MCVYFKRTTAPANTVRCVCLLDRDLFRCWLNTVLYCTWVQLAVAGVDFVALLAHPFPLMRGPGSPRDPGQLL